MIFDSHAHYDDDRYDEDREDVLRMIQEQGVGLIMNAGSTEQTSRAAIELSKAYDFIYSSVGIHPHFVEKITDADIDTLAALATDPKNIDRVKAVGEIGLDYFYDNSPRDIQKVRFAQQIDMARQLSLPIIIHSRDATQDTLEILKRENASVNGGVMHCFAGSRETMEIVVKMGFYVGFGGAVTFKNAHNAVESVRHISEESLLIETDCPYLAPVPHRGERNHSGYLKLIIDKIAEIRETTPEHIEEVTWNNAKNLFRV